EVFENRPDIGGRYSALSCFGLVPALLAGVDVDALLDGARRALRECGPEVDPAANPALAVAAALAAGVRRGRDKATFVLAPAVDAFGLWVEQLVAESLGKDGTGVVPIVGEPLGLGTYGADRLFVAGCRPDEVPDDVPEDARGTVAGAAAQLLAAGLPVTWLPVDAGAASLGHAVVVAELATAWAGAAPATAATAGGLAAGDASVEEVPLDDLLAQVRPGDHLAIQAFLDPESPMATELQAVRTRLRDELQVAVSLGFGPRFLHSTGQ